MPGKVPPDTLADFVFSRTGEEDSSVLQGPADGEDAAAIEWPTDQETLVVSSDPISLAADAVGTLGVHVACNDIAASGADPRWLTVVMLLAPGTAPEPITADLDAAAREVGASIVGGHSETVDALDRPLLSLTAMGTTNRFIPTGGASPGDCVILTKAAGIEGTAILAADFGDELGLDAELCKRASAFLESISVIPDSRTLRKYATALHDPTEGGVTAGLLEIARASDVQLEIEREAIPIREETRAVTAAAGVDPLRIFGSGALLGTVPAEAVPDALAALEAAGLEAAEIGSVTDGPGGLLLDGNRLEGPIEDDLYPLWAAADE